ncbi:MAG: transcriptional regulator, partial [Bacteroidetes bacterium]|nr:transcriptional regulator [Bacteroidota bacterium]
MTEDTNKTVWIIDIPKHSPRKPVYAHKIAWQRKGDNLITITKEREEVILTESLRQINDWSASICTDATIDDLDSIAIAKSRENYSNKFPELSEEIAQWDNPTFLNKAKLTIKGNITHTAILLLGKHESEHFISPTESKIRWVLKDHDGMEKDYEIFTCPLILAVDHVYKKIRNLKYRYLKEDSLFPEEVDQYEPFVIREAINNCIAHQDYEARGGRINVIEKDDELVFSNIGTFIPGSVENVIQTDAPEEIYRNPFLVTAMVNLQMVDTIGSGIKRMFTLQRNKFFPMPQYDFSTGKVKVTITGKVLDLNYARALARNPELGLKEIIMLDKVQKKVKINEAEFKHLKSKGLIEGTKRNYFIAAKVAQRTGQKAAYTKSKAFNQKQYFDWIIQGIKQHGSLT